MGQECTRQSGPGSTPCGPGPDDGGRSATNTAANLHRDGASPAHWRKNLNHTHGTMNTQQLEKIREGDGFIAALDQSGGSTPKALKAYGVGEDRYGNDEEMFDRIHEMRTRIITSPAFDGDRIVGAILFENTMDREIEGRGSADYLWSVKRVVPILKVDKGLADERDGVQTMKPMPGLEELLDRAREKGVFGTKMRSVIKLANRDGVRAIADQQFEVGQQIQDAGLVPILEPEIDIKSPEKAEAEALLKEALLEGLESVRGDVPLMFKLTLPEQDGFYRELVDHPRVLKVVALSGGYSRDEANARLARNPGVIASFSRALTEGLHADQSDEEFNRALDEAIDSIYAASVA
jgi:fructose-bisphosphate aldolase, class I